MELKELNKEYLPTNEMCSIAKKYGTDKHQHGYTKIYYELMKDKRNDPISIFEIGIYLGNSIKMWHEFFPSGLVCGIDNGRLLPNVRINLGNGNENPSEDDKALLKESSVVNVDFNWIENDRIKCSIADQRSISQLDAAFKHFGTNEFDFIVDDGHHFQEHQQKTLGLLFPNIKSGGYYVIEDICDWFDLQNGSFWGQKKSDATDSSDYIFTKFIKDGILESEYMTPEEIKYITENISDIFLYDGSGRNSSPITGPSKILVIKKK